MAAIAKGFLGIDAGTQGLSVVFADEKLDVIASGDGSYEMIQGLEQGCYEQNPRDWGSALQIAMQDLRRKMESHGKGDFEVLCIGISGQMHGEVLVDAANEPIGNARLWCDSRNEGEGNELTEFFQVKIPKRITAARWLWTTRNQVEAAKRTKRITTPAGWLSYCLTGEWNLGIGDASGMFPVDQKSLGYNAELLEQFTKIVSGEFPTLGDLLPKIRRAGEYGGALNDYGSKLLNLEPGIPVAPAEGDQPAALAGSMIAEAGMVSVSFGTSVCANSVGDRAFEGVSPAIDHFCAVDGKPINMVFLRNGTTFMNSVVKMFADNSRCSFDDLMLQVLDAEVNCGGLVAIPFMDDEPGLGIGADGHAALVNLSNSNALAGNAIRAALTSTMLNLKAGMSLLDDQGYPRTEIVLTGGLTKTPELGQILADVTQTKVTLPSGSDEGTALGAAILASYRFAVENGADDSWSEFVRSRQSEAAQVFAPNSNLASIYQEVDERYQSEISRLTG